MTGTTSATSGFSPEVFARFWADPNPAEVPAALTEDVVGYWPGRRAPVYGRAAYTKCIADLLALIPDFRGELLEHAAANDLFFIRWLAFGTGIKGPFDLRGIDRVRVRDGVVAENVIFFDTGEFREVTGHEVPWRDAGPVRAASSTRP
jgi:hypothetical protein